MEVITAGTGKPKLSIKLDIEHYYLIQEDFCEKRCYWSLKRLCEKTRKASGNSIVCNDLFKHCKERGLQSCPI